MTSGKAALVAVVAAVAVAGLPPVRRGLSRLLVLSTGTVVRTQKRIR